MANKGVLGEVPTAKLNRNSKKRLKLNTGVLCYGTWTLQGVLPSACHTCRNCPMPGRLPLDREPCTGRDRA